MMQAIMFTSPMPLGGGVLDVAGLQIRGVGGSGAGRGKRGGGKGQRTSTSDNGARADDEFP